MFGSPKRLFCLSAAAVAALVLVGVPLWLMRDADDGDNRVVLIGLDGAHWEIMLPLFEQGRLPTLATLYREGSSGILWSEEPTVTPAVWTTILTGRDRDAHGIHGFSGPDPESGLPVSVRSTMRRVPAIWDVLNHFGFSVGISGAHVTWPAEEVDGFMVTRQAAWRSEGATYPPGLAAHAKKGENEALREILVQKPPDDGDPESRAFEHLARSFAVDVAAYDLGVELARKDPPDLVFVYFHIPDVAQHVFWPEAPDPNLPPSWPPDFRYIERIYDYVDARLAELLDAVRTPQTAVMVVSDHGAQAGGYLELFERHTDRLIEAMGYLEHDRQASGRADIDRATSRILPHVETARMVQFRVNRDLPELAEDPELRRALAEEFSDALATVHLEQDERPLFGSIEISDDGAEITAQLQLLSGSVDDHVLVGARRIPVTDLYQPIQFNSSHSRRGVLIATGGPFRKGVSLFPPDWVPGTDGNGIESATIYDVFPTALAALHCPVPSGLDGRILTELFDLEWLSGIQLSDVELPWEGVATQDVETPAEDPQLEALKALGYVR